MQERIAFSVTQLLIALLLLELLSWWERKLAEHHRSEQVALEERRQAVWVRQHIAEEMGAVLRLLIQVVVVVRQEQMGTEIMEQMDKPPWEVMEAREMLETEAQED
jgi:hypothetical protein